MSRRGFLISLVAALVLAASVLTSVLALDRLGRFPDHIALRRLEIEVATRLFRPRVAIFGDSITEHLRTGTICGQRFLNAGISGIDASHLITVIADAPRNGQFQALLIAIGTNDTETTETFRQKGFEQLFSLIISDASRLAPRVIVVGPPPIDFSRGPGLTRSGDRLAQIQATERRLAAQRHLQFVDLDRAYGGVANPAMFRDGLHPNANGYRRWKAAVCRVMAPAS